IDHILASAERAAELTKQMLAYAGKGRLVVERVNLAALVSEMTELLRTAISKKVRLDYQVEPNLPAVEADAAQMQQIVMNLITNAADAIGDRSGGVNVAIRQLELDPKQSEFTFISPDLRRGRFVCLEVTDTGDGMSPDTLARIFDPFFTTKSTGRGLGLAATIGIVRGHAGALRVESAEGQGTRFQV